MSKEEEKKPKPPNPPADLNLVTNALLTQILSVESEALKALNEIQNGVVFNNQKLDQLYQMSAESNNMLSAIEKTLAEIEATTKSSLLVQEESRDYLKQIAKNTFSPPEKHTYTLVVRQINILTRKPKEGKMAVQPGIGSAFAVDMQDNGNVITPPAGNVYAWGTDDATDVIEAQNAAADVVTITVADPPAAGRTSLTVTAEGTAPDGSTISGSVTTDIVPVVGHTYTLVVGQVVMSPVGRQTGSKRSIPNRKKK